MNVGVPAAVHPEICCDALEFTARNEVLPSLQSHICCLHTLLASIFLIADTMLFPICFDTKDCNYHKKSKVANFWFIQDKFIPHCILVLTINLSAKFLKKSALEIN